MKLLACTANITMLQVIGIATGFGQINAPTLSATGQQVASPVPASMGLASWIGPAIVAAIVTFLGQFLLSRRHDQKERSRQEEAAVADAVAPVIEASDDIVARLFDVIKRKVNMGLKDFQFPDELTEDMLRNPPLALTTVYRFAKFFASEAYLQRKISVYGEMPRVQIADWLATRKVRMALKGNLCDAASRLPTETQHFIGAKFLSLTPTGKPDDLDFYTFMTKTIGDQQAKWAAMCIARFLSFDPDFTIPQGQQVSVSLMLVYMIDLHQDLFNSSKWEEFRVCLASFIRAWNSANAGRSIYLYNPQDLSHADYRECFATLHFMNESKRKRNRRLARRQSRGRTLTADGITRVRGNATQHFKFAQSLGDLMHAIETLS